VYLRLLATLGLLAVVACEPATAPTVDDAAPAEDREPVAGGALDPEAAPADFQPIDTTNAVFWVRQTRAAGELLEALGQEFNEQRQGLPLKTEHQGNYSDIFRKVRASIVAGRLPAMAVSYESMTAEYARAGAAVDLDTLLADPAQGLTWEDREDFFPVVIESNRYPDLGDALYSFPFSKSVLVMYFNKTVMAEAGLEEPPATWDEFIDACRTVKRETGKYGYAISIDPSTVDGIIFSLGGDVVDGRTTLFDAPEAIRCFEIFETLVEEDVAYVIPPDTFEDEAAFVDDRVAFVLRTSAAMMSLREMKDDLDSWGVGVIPQANPEEPVTVLFGPNVTLFDVGEEQVATAWSFTKYFISPDVNVRWALATGYVPIRKSAARDPRMQAHWADWTYNRVPFDCLAFARSEPNLAGWQEVRTLIDEAQTAVVSGMLTAEEAARNLKREADQALARAATAP
jgi:ABC-type glycerol-3-phosphate transport system substrate-binding protein